MKCAKCHTELPDTATYCLACGAKQQHATKPIDFEYAAFISYRHCTSDSKTAKKLQRAIETYRLPKDIASAYGSRHIGKIFRDQDELPVTTSLPDAIRDALIHSSALIVVCSPATPQSEWVNQEIETFISYHGRDRLFAVLCEGSSDESLPRALTKSEGGSNKQRAQPLAADFRNPTKRRFAEEKLRLIAAILNCKYDALARRQKARARKTTAVTCALGAVLLCAIVAIGLSIRSTQINAYLSESQRFAASAIALYENGRVLDASREALAAADAAEKAGGRDLVPEAQRALETVAAISPPLDRAWRPCDSRMVSEGIDSLVVNNDGTLYAIVDSDLNILVYSTSFEAPLETLSLPKDTDLEADNNPNNWELYFSGSNLIASNSTPGSSGTCACFDIRDGTMRWSTCAFANAICFTRDRKFALFSFLSLDGKRFNFGRIDLETGKTGFFGKTANRIDSPSEQDELIGACNSETQACFAAGSTIALFDSTSNETHSTQTAYSHVSSMRWCDNVLVVVSYDTSHGFRNMDFEYAIEGYDVSLERIWRNDGSFTVNALGTDQSYSIPNAMPTVANCSPNSSNVLVSVNNVVSIVSSHDGSISKVFQSKSPIISLSDCNRLLNGHFACIADASGEITPLLENEDGTMIAIDECTLNLPARCETIYFGCNDQLGLQAVALSSSESGRFYAYRTFLGQSNPRTMEVLENPITGNCTYFKQSYDGEFVLAANDDDSKIEIINGYTLEHVTTIDITALAGQDRSEFEYSLYLPKCIPDKLYLCITPKDKPTGNVYAYDLSSQKVCGTLAVRQYEEQLHNDADYPQFLSYATSFGGYFINMQPSTNDSPQLKLVEVNPFTLEIIGETPISPVKIPIGVWDLGSKILMMSQPAKNQATRQAKLTLVDKSDGKHIDSDIDAYMPYEAQPSDLSCMAINSQVNCVVLACNDGKLRCFDLPSGKFLWETQFNGEASRSLIFQNGGKLLFAQDGKGICSFIDTETGRIVGLSNDELKTISDGRFSKDGLRFYGTYKVGGDAVTSMYVMTNSDHRIGISSELNGVAYMSTNEIEMIKHVTSTRAAIVPYFTIDELYNVVKRYVEFKVNKPEELFVQDVTSTNSDENSGNSNNSDDAEKQGRSNGNSLTDDEDTFFYLDFSKSNPKKAPDRGISGLDHVL